MIKKLRVTVDGNTYEVTVETADDGYAPAAGAPPPVAAPVSAPPVMPPPPPPIATPAPAASSSAPAGPGDVASPLAGRVTAIAIKAGQSVAEGDNLLTLEAMKMNTFVNAPRAGKVAEVKVAVGDAVVENQALVRLE